MDRLTIYFCSILAFASGCDRAGQQMTQDFVICEQAMAQGRLDVAENRCASALDPTGEHPLDAATRSERLFRFGSIKRQLAKYAEAKGPLHESIEIETTLSGADDQTVVRRRLELALVLAGQKEWLVLAHELEALVGHAEQLDIREQRSLSNLLRVCAARLEQLDDDVRAARLRAAGESINQS